MNETSAVLVSSSRAVLAAVMIQLSNVAWCSRGLGGEAKSELTPYEANIFPSTDAFRSVG